MITPRVATATALRDRHRRILLIRRGPGSVNGAGEWAFPGGKLDPMETLAFGAAREMEEEVGVRTRVRSTGVITEDAHWGPDLHFVTHYYQAVEWEGEPRLMESNKHDGIRWVHEDVLRRAADLPDPDLPLFATTRAFVLAGGIDALVSAGDLPEPRTLRELGAAMERLVDRCRQDVDDAMRESLFMEALKLLLEIRVPRTPETVVELEEMLRRSDDGRHTDIQQAFDGIRTQRETMRRFLDKYRALVAAKRWEDAARMLLPAPSGEGIRWKCQGISLDIAADHPDEIAILTRSVADDIVVTASEGTAGLAAVVEAHLRWPEVWRR